MPARDRKNCTPREFQRRELQSAASSPRAPCGPAAIGIAVHADSQLPCESARGKCVATGRYTHHSPEVSREVTLIRKANRSGGNRRRRTGLEHQTRALDSDVD